LDNDTWDVRDSVFATYGLTISNHNDSKQIHFSTFKEERLKNEAKFYLVYSMKNRLLSPVSVFNSCKAPLDYLASFMNVHGKRTSFNGMEIGDMQLVRFLKNRGICTEKSDGEAYRNHLWFRSGLLRFITAYYDEREETEKDVWIAV